MVNTILFLYNENYKPSIPHEDRKYIQKVVGKILHHERAVNTTMLVVLGTLSSAQSK